MSDNNYYIKYIAKNRNARISREKLKNEVERRNPYMFSEDKTLDGEDVVWYQFEEREIIDHLTEDDENLVSDSDKSGSLIKRHIQKKSGKYSEFDEYKEEIPIGQQGRKIIMYELEDYKWDIESNPYYKQVERSTKEEKYRNLVNNSQKIILGSIERSYHNKYSSENNYNDQDKDKDVSIFQLPFPEDDADFQQKSSDINNKDRSRIIHRKNYESDALKRYVSEEEIKAVEEIGLPSSDSKFNNSFSSLSNLSNIDSDLSKKQKRRRRKKLKLNTQTSNLSNAIYDLDDKVSKKTFESDVMKKDADKQERLAIIRTNNKYGNFSSAIIRFDQNFFHNQINH